ncbi:hypothetical protein MPP7335_04665 [Mycolicibacterium parafortuitum]|uniref:Uncharacterized protein n=1 Tax=Mycolicibacterium parafortuitum TaxID=39692 RepID=A0A375YP34_MYCPF|nr:hypothetical protein MPP7335_04665 [Mycolicibacterium parafortuitum]
MLRSVIHDAVDDRPMTDLDGLFRDQGGVATTGQLLAYLTRSRLDIEIREGGLIKVWPGVYSRDEPDIPARLRGLDLRAGEPVAICLGTAAAAYGFDTEDTSDIPLSIRGGTSYATPTG